MSRDFTEEIDALKDELAQQQREFDAILEQKNFELKAAEDVTREKLVRLEGQWKEKLKVQEKTMMDQMKVMSKELDKLRNAFSGDSGGWVTKTNRKGTFYENVETGEVQETMPEVLYISNAMLKIEEAEKKLVEFENLKVRCKEAEMKKREGDLLINKLSTEVNALRTLEKGWVNAAKLVYRSTSDLTRKLNERIVDLEERVEFIGNKNKQLYRKNKKIIEVRQLIKELQATNSAQEKQIYSLQTKNQKLTAELQSVTGKYENILRDVEEEVNKQVKPMRDQVADAVVSLMKEKAARGLERRNLADLWPEGYLMPTVLMRYRNLSDQERQRRIESAKALEAARALTLEIRANVIESTKWSAKYDDYGRLYYEHADTGASSWDPPEIMSYEPPPGRDSMGNLIIDDSSYDPNWKLKADYRGEVYYYNEKTGESSYVAPNAYRKIPPAKGMDVLVTEAAQLVLSYLKSKIELKISKYGRTTAAGGEKDLGDEEEEEDEDDEDGQEDSVVKFAFKDRSALKELDNIVEAEEDLSKYIYDIETIELLALGPESFAAVKPVVDAAASGTTTKKDAGKGERGPHDEELYTVDPQVVRTNKRTEDLARFYAGPSLADVDVESLDTVDLRAILLDLSAAEEKLESRLTKIRENRKVRSVPWDTRNPQCFEGMESNNSV